MLSLRKIISTQAIPKDVKLLTWATTIRWIGWGFVESLIPVFLLAFSSTYAETGLLRSVYDVTYILLLPFIGMLADIIPPRTILLLGIVLYPFVGFSYFWAGVTGSALFIVIGRFLNGAGYALDSIGRSTYFRKHSPTSNIATAFGYFDTITTFFWVVCVFVSIILIRHFEIHQLFLVIIPTSLIALYMIFRLKRDIPSGVVAGVRKVWRDGVVSNFVQEVRGWSSSLRLIGFLTFLLGFVGIATSFSIPLAVYADSGNLVQVIVIGAVAALPSVFSFPLGKIADKWRMQSVYAGFVIAVISLGLLALFPVFWVQLVLAFLLSIGLNLTSLAFDGIATLNTNPEHYGRMSSVLANSGSVGELIGPIIAGVLIDAYGSPVMFVVFAAITAIGVLLLVAQRKKHGSLSSI